MTNGLATHETRATTLVAPDARVSAHLLAARLIGHAVMADVVMAASPLGCQIAREVARMFRTPWVTAGHWSAQSGHPEGAGMDLSRARVVVVDAVMGSPAAIISAIRSARERGARPVAVAVPVASAAAVAAVLPLVHSVHTLSVLERFQGG